VLREDGVTTVIQGDAEKVRRRHEQELAAAIDMTVEEMKQKTLMCSTLLMERCLAVLCWDTRIKRPFENSSTSQLQCHI
jgi:hypothetical protein